MVCAASVDTQPAPAGHVKRECITACAGRLEVTISDAVPPDTLALVDSAGSRTYGFMRRSEMFVTSAGTLLYVAVTVAGVCHASVIVVLPSAANATPVFCVHAIVASPLFFASTTKFIVAASQPA